jgi:hypothetical protein
MPDVTILVGMRLDEIVYMARQTIQAYKQFTPGVREYIGQERSIPKAERLSLKEIFILRMPDRFAQYKLNADGVDSRHFGEWLWKNPLRALGMRLFFEADRQMVKDTTRPFEDGDIADFAHIAALPYADFTTMDKRIADLTKSVARRLGINHPQADLSNRVFAKVGDLLAVL